MDLTFINSDMEHCLHIEDKHLQLSLSYLKATHYLASVKTSVLIDISVLWRQNFQAQIDFKNKLIIFDNEYDKTLFLLQWS